jgi:hypothetical protein
MFYKVHGAPVEHNPLPEPVAFRAVTSLNKPDCPEHVEQVVHSPFWADFKFAHFENYKRMHQTETWIYPVSKSLIPPKDVILPIRSTYSVKSTET